MKYGYREIRKIGAMELRNLCIKRNWYTCGNNEEYSHLLGDLAEDKENITTDDIIEIAQDIYEHSSKESMIDFEFEDICAEVALTSFTYFEKTK
ncbi:hypothetical protein GCM10008910_45390 [Faecalicatena orotica]|uniref:Uncharacterized protein n=1 Tax=Faecalicatena orotica TaxID=1544 RepID=A0A2Y9BDG0_9FIRM|nr:hypothetical protein [Faecalicatena orotica]PWJ29517.1 hypothetical protein A8806_106256 [Faecalicatena orotica]SSA55972.1 hypothetical protein SAMN05216536_106256 [Faecalicatena orotica]